MAEQWALTSSFCCENCSMAHSVRDSGELMGRPRLRSTTTPAVTCTEGAVPRRNTPLVHSAARTCADAVPHA